VQCRGLARATAGERTPTASSLWRAMLSVAVVRDGDRRRGTRCCSSPWRAMLFVAVAHDNAHRLDGVMQIVAVDETVQLVALIGATLGPLNDRREAFRARAARGAVRLGCRQDVARRSGRHDVFVVVARRVFVVVSACCFPSGGRHDPFCRGCSSRCSSGCSGCAVGRGRSGCSWCAVNMRPEEKATNELCLCTTMWSRRTPSMRRRATARL
jgi:hypothetical protein